MYVCPLADNVEFSFQEPVVERPVQEPFLEINNKTYITATPPVLLFDFVLKKKGLVKTASKVSLVTCVLTNQMDDKVQSL